MPIIHQEGFLFFDERLLLQTVPGMFYQTVALMVQSLHSKHCNDREHRTHGR